MQINQLNYIKQLPDAFRKDTTSNNYRILQINQQAISKLYGDIEDVSNALDLMQATGKTLDLYGELLDQPRGDCDDTQYRFLLLAKISRNFLKGDYENTVTSIATALRIETTDFLMKEHETRCAVEFTKFPIEVLTKTTFKSKQVYEIIKQLLPVGVELILDEFQGTFILCENDGEMSNERGLADEAETIGGTLGLTLGADE